jgi:hypothetical protein
MTCEGLSVRQTPNDSTAFCEESEASAIVPAASGAIVLPDTPTREDIERFELLLLAGETEHGVELPTRHHFAPGQYARELFIPAGTYLTGARHKHAHLVTFVGDITVWTEGAKVRFTGCHTLQSLPGAKRVGYAHADTYCIGYFPTEETDVRKLEEMLVEDSHLLQCNRRPVLPYSAGNPIPLIEE